MKIVNFKILIFDQILPKFRFWRAFQTLKSPKSSSGDVFVFKNCLKLRMMFLFTSDCYQGPKLEPNIFKMFLVPAKKFAITSIRWCFPNVRVIIKFASQEPKTLLKSLSKQWNILMTWTGMHYPLLLMHVMKCVAECLSFRTHVLLCQNMC